MEEIWSHSEDVVNLGPFGNRELGWTEVRGLLENLGRMNMGGRLEVRDLNYRIYGDLGYVFYTQHCSNLVAEGKPIDVDVRATSIFRREGGKWRLIHHHADLSPVMQEAYREFMLSVEVAAD